MNIHVSTRMLVGPLLILAGIAMWIWGPGVVAATFNDGYVPLFWIFGEESVGIFARAVALAVGLLGCVLTIREI